MPDIPDDEFQKLLEQALQGDEVAWGRLLAECRPQFKRLAEQILDERRRRRVDESDVAQCVFGFRWRSIWSLDFTAVTFRQFVRPRPFRHQLENVNSSFLRAACPTKYMIASSPRKMIPTMM